MIEGNLRRGKRMSIWTFLKQQEIDDAPEGELGFAELVRIAQERLNDRVGRLDEENERQWRAAEELRAEFSLVVLSLGRSYEIEPFSSMDPREIQSNAVEFKARLEDYVAQLVVRTAIAAKRDSMVLTADVKERIRTHLHHIREQLDRAGVDEARRVKLHAKLAEFEASLEKDRINIFAVARVAMEILSLSVNVLALSDSATLQKLLSNMMQTVAEAKAADDIHRQHCPIPYVQPAALPPKQKQDGEEIPF
jgi:hypothetical protein